MKCLSYLFTITILSFYISNSFSQDTITFLNGKEVAAKIIDTSLKKENPYITYMETGRKKTKKTSRLNVFSVRYNNGKEEFIYSKDTSLVDDFNIEEMRMFIRGEQEAMRSYKNRAVTVGGFIAGSVGGYFTFYGLFVPAVYSTIIGSGSPDIEKHSPSLISKPYLQNTEFLMGYQKKARDMKISNSLKAGAVGFAVSFTALIFLLGD